MELADPAIYDASKYVQDITGKDPRPARKANEDLSAYQLLLNSWLDQQRQYMETYDDHKWEHIRTGEVSPYNWRKIILFLVPGAILGTGVLYLPKSTSDK